MHSFTPDSAARMPLAHLRNANMKRCERCNKKRGFIERLLSTDKTLCEDCLYDVMREVREKIPVPFKQHKR